jgi:hypothetical protein
VRLAGGYTNALSKRKQGMGSAGHKNPTVQKDNIILQYIMQEAIRNHGLLIDKN